jgi:hypothetical protein
MTSTFSWYRRAGIEGASECLVIVIFFYDYIILMTRLVHDGEQKFVFALASF